MAYEGPVCLLAERSEAGVNDTADVDNRYRYNGKEFQSEHSLNWSAYGARYYDPVVGRFTGVDPLADKFFYVTPYNYAENEPIANVDLWGTQKLSAHVNLKGGSVGVSGVAAGTKVGGILNLGGHNVLGAEGYIDFNKLNHGGKLNFMEDKREVGISVGKVFGLEISTTFDPSDESRTEKIEINAGFFNQKYQVTKNKLGEEIDKVKSTGISLGGEIGLGAIGIEGEISLDFEEPEPPKAQIPIQNTVQQDNTKVNIQIVNQKFKKQ